MVLSRNWKYRNGASLVCILFLTMHTQDASALFSRYTGKGTHDLEGKPQQRTAFGALVGAPKDVTKDHKRIAAQHKKEYEKLEKDAEANPTGPHAAAFEVMKARKLHRENQQANDTAAAALKDAGKRVGQEVPKVAKAEAGLNPRGRNPDAANQAAEHAINTAKSAVERTQAYVGAVEQAREMENATSRSANHVDRMEQKFLAKRQATINKHEEALRAHEEALGEHTNAQKAFEVAHGQHMAASAAVEEATRQGNKREAALAKAAQEKAEDAWRDAALDIKTAAGKIQRKSDALKDAAQKRAEADSLHDSLFPAARGAGTGSAQ